MKMRGMPVESYDDLQSYLYILKKTNPVTVIDIVFEDDEKFKYVFMAIAASIE